MTRHNLNTNPACKNNVTGWGGGSTPAQQDVTGLGFIRNTAARYTTGTFLRTSSGSVVAGTQYTLSVYIRSTNASSGTAYLAWVNGGGSDLSYTTTSYSASAGTVTRISVTGTAPANAVTANMILDGVNYGLNTTDITAVLLEAAASAGTYFDGDTANASWDGTNGNSASTLAGFATVTGTASASLTLTATATGTRSVLGTAAASPALTATAAGARTVLGTAAFTGTLTASAIGSVANLPDLGGTLTAASTLAGTLTTTSTLAGTLVVSSALAGTLA